MLNFHIEIETDDDFGVPQFTGYSVPSPYKIKGISRCNAGGTSVVDSNIFFGKNFFKPVEKILSYNKSIKDITDEEFKEIVSEFGKYFERSSSLYFQNNNDYDLDFCYLEKDRICFNYRHCPVNSFYLMDINGYLRINVSPFTKNFYTITETQWKEFVNYISDNKSIVEKRNVKIDQLLGDSKININLMRQFEFVVENERNISTRTLDGIYSFYKERGYLTDKQVKFVEKSIWE